MMLTFSSYERILCYWFFSDITLRTQVAILGLWNDYFLDSDWSEAAVKVAQVYIILLMNYPFYSNSSSMPDVQRKLISKKVCKWDVRSRLEGVHDYDDVKCNQKWIKNCDMSFAVVV